VRFRPGPRVRTGWLSNRAAVLDVIIVGAGPAGLSAALILGRSRKRIAICDAGQPRNFRSRAVHGLLSREGADPAELRGIAREQLRPFEAVFHEGPVTNPIRRPSAFEIELSDGTTISARRILLAMGVVDILPEIDGFQDLWGVSVFNCPYCDGWEVRGEALAVYGKGDAAVELALLLTAWTSDTIVCSDGPARLSLEQERRLASAGIALIQQKIARLKEKRSLLEVEFEDGSVLARRALFLQPKLHYNNALAAALGCVLNEGGAIQTGARYETSIPGVYAAGNCTGSSGQIVDMASHGAKAAYAINRDLVDEDLRTNSQPRRERFDTPTV
jgi:thioredoxin reductase